MTDKIKQKKETVRCPESQIGGQSIVPDSVVFQPDESLLLTDEEIKDIKYKCSFIERAKDDCKGVYDCQVCDGRLVARAQLAKCQQSWRDEREAMRVCEFCHANIKGRTNVDMRNFICTAPKQDSKWFTAGRIDEQRFIINEVCLSDFRARCFIWQDMQKEHPNDYHRPRRNK